MCNHRRELFRTLYDVLEQHFGPTHWWPADTPFEVCIGAILTQNAPWTGVVRSIDALKDAGLFAPEKLASASPDTLAECIRPSIYYNQKAKRIRSFCSFLMQHYDGNIELMAAHTIETARHLLLEQHGIGKETADSILCYALRKPVFVVDAYTRRIFRRHGLVSRNIDYDTLQHFFTDVLEPDTAHYAEFHALICVTGAKFCRRTPNCNDCPVSSVLGEGIA